MLYESLLMPTPLAAAALKFATSAGEFGSGAGDAPSARYQKLVELNGVPAACVGACGAGGFAGGDDGENTGCEQPTPKTIAAPAMTSRPRIASSSAESATGSAVGQGGLRPFRSIDPERHRGATSTGGTAAMVPATFVRLRPVGGGGQLVTLATRAASTMRVNTPPGARERARPDDGLDA
jgi:hypothetical protein